MTVVKELDKALFEGYIKPKANTVTELVRNGILDSQMDWYETPQPTGKLPRHMSAVTDGVIYRDSSLHVRNIDVLSEDPRPDLQCG